MNDVSYETTSFSLRKFGVTHVSAVSSHNLRRSHHIKTSLILFTILAVLILTSAPAAANPATLPKHPGYPMDKATDPVKGQSLANDPGQGNATGDKALMEASAFEDTHVMQSLSGSPNEEDIRSKMSPTVSPKKEQTEKRRSVNGRKLNCGML